MNILRTLRAATPAATAALATLALPALAAADPEQRPYGYDGYGYGHMMWGGWGGMLFGSGLMVLFVIAVVIILVRALGGGDGSSSRPPTGNPGLDVLNERYARGEIDTAEYNERKKHLLSGD